jgi:glycosyltransferase involved in cell wall biosynthesis
VLPQSRVATSSAITFAIPFYSGTRYLRRAIESIFAQTDPAWHAIVVDDGAEAGVDELVRSYGDRVAYVRNPKNLGIGGNFNRCLDLAATDLVTVLHADDELMPGYGATMRDAAARHPAAAAVFCRARIIGPDDQPAFSLADVVKDRIHPSRRRELTLRGEPGIRALLRANFIVAPTLCFRKSVLRDRRFPAQYKFVLDWELTTQLLLDGDSLVGIPERCYRYRRHGEAATSKYTRTHLRFREESDYYDRMQATARSRGWDRCVALASDKRMTKLNVTYCAIRSAAALQFGDARRSLQLLREL